MNIYVGNLPFEITDESLATMFKEHGEVTSAKVIIDRYSDRSRGFRFVEMSNNDEAEAAIQALNGVDQGELALTVNEAKPREDRGPRRWQLIPRAYTTIVLPVSLRPTAAASLLNTGTSMAPISWIRNFTLSSSFIVGSGQEL